MHGFSFAKVVLNDLGCLKESKRDISHVCLELGELVAIEKEDLLDALKNLSKISFSIESKASFVKCACGYSGSARIRERLHDFVIFDCPKCGNVPEVIFGDRIEIKKIIYC